MALDLKKASKGFWKDEHISTNIYRSIAVRWRDGAKLLYELAEMEASYGALS